VLKALVDTVRFSGLCNRILRDATYGLIYCIRIGLIV